MTRILIRAIVAVLALALVLTSWWTLGVWNGMTYVGGS